MSLPCFCWNTPSLLETPPVNIGPILCPVFVLFSREVKGMALLKWCTPCTSLLANVVDIFPVLTVYIPRAEESPTSPFL